MGKVAVIQYPGSNCDLDALEILRDVVKAKTDLVWHKDLTHDDYAAYVLPGGSSYGYYLDKEQIPELERNQQIVFRYVNEKKEATEEANPNGSIDNIAGVCNQKGNVMGLMPHPERASILVLSLDNQTDGRVIFDSMMRTLHGPGA